MKLKAKGKLILTVFLVLFACFTILLGYYRFFYLHHVAQELNNLIQQGTPVTREQISSLKTENEMLFLSGVILGSALLIFLFFVWRLLLNPLLFLNRNLKYGKIKEWNAIPPNKRRDEWDEIYQQVKEMNYRLEDTNRIKTQMLSAVSHDLRTPLTSICGYMERLIDGKVKSEEKKAEYYHIIYKKAKVIEKLVSDYTEYLKHEDNLVFNREKVHLKRFLESILEEYKEDFHFVNSTLRITCEVKDDFTLPLNENLMRRVFSNLLGNALEHNDRPIVVSCTCYTNRDYVTIHLEDNGKGVPPEDLARIFDKFYCVDKARSNERRGSGLGLTICKRIVELHDGKIEAYRAPYGGLGFTIQLKRPAAK
ncbi:sensor histidine kinase [Brevibacillus fluminis]|uniref:sensor histidine kinase n=1 Tax=Brevibacillus fluminis TaxID=511487 RepID=UPI003F88B9A2